MIVTEQIKKEMRGNTFSRFFLLSLRYFISDKMSSAVYTNPVHKSDLIRHGREGLDSWNMQLMYLQ